MTVPADASVNTTSSTNKLRPLTALPVPMLPSAEQLAKARPQTSTSAPTPPGATRLTSIKNASLSSWLSHGIQNTAGSHSPGSNGHPIDVIHPEGIDNLKIGPDPQEHISTESMDVDGHHDTDAHPRDASSHTPPPPPNGAPMKGKRGRKPKPKPDPNDPNSPPPKPKERKPRTPKDPLEPKVPKEKAPRKKKADVAGSGDIGGDGTTGRSILNYFKSNSGPGKAPSAKAFKQSCLAFDVVDAEKAKSYFTAGNDDDRRMYGGIMRDIPKLVGRAPYEDLVGGLLLRSSRLPTLHKLELQQQEITMDMLADIKMVHEFLNTFGTPLGLTKDSGEWITFDSLLSMIKNPRVDSRLMDLNYRMVLAAYDEDQSSRINYHNFTYFLATGPEAVIGNKDEKKNKNWAAKRSQPLNRLGTLEYSSYTAVDRIEALAKALHDITSSNKFHSFMRDEVEENIIVLKRQKRKRAEIRKELETQVHDLEREMKVIERDAGVMEAERQSILATERETGQAEDEGSGRISSTSRQQRLAQAKDARTKANELLSQQKVLASELKVKESSWETKKQELEVISRDDTEMQKDHNVPWTQLRGGHAVNTDEKLRVICLGNDRWGRKYWFWRDFGGVLVEDRGQIGPKVDKPEAKEEPSQPTATHTPEVQREGATVTGDHKEEDMEVEVTTTEEPSKEDDTVADVTRRMETMASPELSGGVAKEEKREVKSSDNRMSISNLLSDDTSDNVPQEVKPIAPERDYLDYGAVQTWSLISTTKELASLTRALNGKGVRERVLKASLITMRKEIEESLPRIKKWAGNQYESKFEHLSELGAMGQLLTLTELQLLKKKRGRKSKQELADIAATEELVAANEAKAMDVDSIPQDDLDHDHDHDMDEPVSGSKEHDHEPDHEDREQNDIEAHEGAQAIEEALVEEEAIVEEMYGEETGPTDAEYLDTIMEAAKTKLLDFSRTICGGDENVILNAVETSPDQSTHDHLTVIVAVLERCLDAMDMQQEDGIEVVEDAKVAKEEAKEVPKKDIAMDVEDAKPVEEGEVDVEAVASEDKIPVSVSPRLLWWLQTCKIDEMLQRVQTFGALHAWLDECRLAITNFVDDGEGDDGEEQGSDVEGKLEEEDEESENSDHHEHDEDDDEDEDEGKDEHDDEEREQA
ncbi:hypothetical protein BG000_011740, partial [Podila horticola]